MKETVDLGDRKVTLLGTAHVSEDSLNDVIDTIEDVKPDLVGVELDEDRFESLKNQSGWKDLNIAEAIREGKGSLLFLNLMLSIYQRKIGVKEGMDPGMEMLEAVEQASGRGIDYALLDRDIGETFDRLRSELSLWEKVKIVGSFFFDESDLEIEELKEEDILGSIIKDLEKEFPTIKRVFLDERNSYMVNKLLERDFDHAVVVVGAAHVEGMKEMLETEATQIVEQEDSLIPWMKIFHYGFPLTIILGLGYSFYQLGFATGLQATKFWILANGILAMAGAIIARSHPITWIISFISAPLTSLDPALGAGMVAAYAEGKLYPPKVEELESIAYVESYRDLWGNQTGRILLTFIFVTLGSAIATFIGAGYIASLITSAPV